MLFVKKKKEKRKKPKCISSARRKSRHITAQTEKVVLPVGWGAARAWPSGGTWELQTLLVAGFFPGKALAPGTVTSLWRARG